MEKRYQSIKKASLKLVLRSLVLYAMVMSFTPKSIAYNGDSSAVKKVSYLFFDRKNITSVTAAPSSGLIAYTVHQHPPGINLESRQVARGESRGVTMGGTPNSMLGSSIYVCDPDGKNVRRLETPGDATAWRPSWSPNGQRLAFYCDASGSPNLWLYDATTGEVRKVNSATIKTTVFPGDDPKWAPDNRTVYVPLAPESSSEFASQSESPPEDGGLTVTLMHSGSEMVQDQEKDKAAAIGNSWYIKTYNAVLAKVDVNTSGVELVVKASDTPYPDRFFRVSPTGKWLSYASVIRNERLSLRGTTVFDLVVSSTSSNQRYTIASNLPGEGLWQRPESHSWHATQDRFFYFKDEGLWQVVFDANGPKAPQQLSPELGPVSFGGGWFTRDGSAVMVRATKHSGITLIPLGGGKPVHLSIESDKWTYRSILSASENIIWQPDGASISLMVTERSTGENAVIRIDIRTKSTRLLWKGKANITNWHAVNEHQSMIGRYEDFITPGDLFRFSVDLAQKERISQMEPQLDQLNVGTAEFIESSVPMIKGTLAKVRAAVVLPPGKKRGDRLPAIVMIYPARDFSQSISSFGAGSPITVPVQIFTQAGFAVVLANMSSELGLPSTSSYDVGQEAVDQLLPQLYRASELGYIDMERLGVTGQSGGGFLTAGVIARTKLFRAAVSINGFFDLGGIRHGRFSVGTVRASRSEGYIWAGRGPLPWDDLRLYFENSAYYQAHKIVTPLFIIQGEEDGSISEAEMMFTALRQLNRPAQLAIYAGQGHVISNYTRKNALDASWRMVEFFSKHLGH